MNDNKQIAKRVIIHGWGKIFNNVRSVCPSCHKVVKNYIFWEGLKDRPQGQKERYCPYCGQKLIYPFYDKNEELVWTSQKDKKEEKK